VTRAGSAVRFGCSVTTGTDVVTLVADTDGSALESVAALSSLGARGVSRAQPNDIMSIPTPHRPDHSFIVILSSP